MKNSNTFSDAEVTQIDQRIGQSFAFMRDVLDDPSLLDEIPSGSTLAFRDIVLLRDYVRLTVFRPATSTAKWKILMPTPQIAARFVGVSRAWDALPRQLRKSTWNSADDALDAFESELRSAVNRKEPARPTTQG
jgi:hypothetical protein